MRLSIRISCSLLLIALFTIALCSCGGSSASTTPPPPQTPAPTATFASSATTISTGESATLSWQTTNATSVAISPAVGSGSPAMSGSASVTPDATTTYTLTAKGDGGTVTQTVTITVNAPAPPTVSFSATPTTVNPGDAVTFIWETTGATSVSITPTVGTGTLALSGKAMADVSQTATYVLTATGPTGLQTIEPVTINVNAAPAIVSFTASPTTVEANGLSTLTWKTTNATAVTITPDPEQGSESGSKGVNSSAQATPGQTTTYTLTATGAAGLPPATATVTVTVSPATLSLTATPATIAPGDPVTLIWQTSGITNLTIDNGGCDPCTLPNNTANLDPPATTTYTATATTTSGQTITQSVVVNVSNSLPTGKLKHIIFMLQENRSFDTYFGMLGPYRAQRLAQFGITAAASDVDGLNCTDANCTNITLKTRSNVPIPNAPVHPFHLQTACTENMTPSWDESHYDVQLQGGWLQTKQPGWTLDPTKFKMNGFLNTTSSIKPVNPSDDPNGTRPLGYYNQADLPVYYDLASFFATSDRWFSPEMANTNPNRMYVMSATSIGHAFPTPPPTGGFSSKTIFEALTEAHVSWRYYYQDNSTFLAQYKDYQTNPIVKGNVYPIQNYFNVLAGNCSGQPCDPDKSLPQVIFIERAGNTGLDEHPDTGSNNQKGAAKVVAMITALMNSKVWADSAFIFTFDEAGGGYDHVPPIQEPLPDNWAPGQCPDIANGDTCRFSTTDAQATFNTSGMRLPMFVVSPYAKPHYVSHTPRDTTAILAFIEETFKVPSLTARDAYYTNSARDMSEFFDFTTPALLNAPDGSAWSTFLPAQPTNLPCNAALGKAPGY